MATKEQVAEFINSNWSTTWSSEEELKIDQMLNPEIADVLIKLVGNVDFLVEVSGNKSN